ncbi:DNA-binding protein [Rudaea sp.]|uniref:DNA-binding protein n=1 Tax=Rudaea sp. TaxID=2136325 RepID=UPI0039E35EFC
MARGVTQDQVTKAADALLARGERPTIEKVRAELGTGSPNTLLRLIEVWWAELAGRLAAQARAQLPEIALRAAPAHRLHPARTLRPISDHPCDSPRSSRRQRSGCAGSPARPQ